MAAARTGATGSRRAELSVSVSCSGGGEVLRSHRPSAWMAAVRTSGSGSLASRIRCVGSVVPADPAEVAGQREPALGIVVLDQSVDELAQTGTVQTADCPGNGRPASQGRPDPRPPAAAEPPRGHPAARANGLPPDPPHARDRPGARPRAAPIRELQTGPQRVLRPSAPWVRNRAAIRGARALPRCRRWWPKPGIAAVRIEGSGSLVCCRRISSALPSPLSPISRMAAIRTSGWGLSHQRGPPGAHPPARSARIASSAEARSAGSGSPEATLISSGPRSRR